MAEKMTKVMWFDEIKAVIENSEYENKEGALEFIDKQVELITSKAAKAKERAEKAKAKGDEMREVVKAVLTEEFQTIDAITAQVEGEEITKAKVTARLTQLVKAGVAEKDQIKEEGSSRKVMVYRLIEEAEPGAPVEE